MGGRGASAGVRYAKGKIIFYGDEYKTVFQSGNIKFVKSTDEGESTTAPMETVTKDRIYVTVNKDDELRSIVFFDENGKRTKQIDLVDHNEKIDGERVVEHTHYGYFHKEHGTYKPSEEELKIIELVRNIWQNRGGK